ncbi:hypothetical protein CFC21_021217 [Triticum aestivum]|uniref:Uncharacterized protein n=2 Tax=Triticum aestivum TaxID=4565 RepID=A0A9R1EA99_WHEAT|nr:hypothetical protein CFC21_021217 [Triticum aestivum]
MCPFHSLAGTMTNYAIIDAARTERNVVLHVVDLGSADATQWLILLHLFAKHPGAGAHDEILRLTIVNEEDEFLSVTGALLAREAESLHIGFQFHPVKLHINQLLSVEPLGVRSGEALVIVFTLQLHHLLADELVVVAARPPDRKGKVRAHATMTRDDALLRDVAELSPKLMVVNEQEANHNGEFMGWFNNMLNYMGPCLMPWRRAYLHAGRQWSDRMWNGACSCRRSGISLPVMACNAHERMVKWAEQMKAVGLASTTMSADAVAQTVMLGQMVTGCSRAYRVSSEKDVYFYIH